MIRTHHHRNWLGVGFSIGLGLLLFRMFMVLIVLLCAFAWHATQEMRPAVRNIVRGTFIALGDSRDSGSDHSCGGRISTAHTIRQGSLPDGCTLSAGGVYMEMPPLSDRLKYPSDGRDVLRSDTVETFEKSSGELVQQLDEILRQMHHEEPSAQSERSKIQRINRALLPLLERLKQVGYLQATHIELDDEYRLVLSRESLEGE